MGQKRRSLSEWEALVADQQSSGLSQSAFCKSKGINYHTFLDRSQQIRKQQKQPGNQKTQWVEAQEPAQPENTEAIQIEIGSFCVKVPENFSKAGLQRVCKALVSLC